VAGRCWIEKGDSVMGDIKSDLKEYLETHSVTSADDLRIREMYGRKQCEFKSEKYAIEEKEL